MNDDKNREKTIELLRRLENNEIDQETFNREFYEFVRSEEFKNNQRRANRIHFSFLKNIWFIVFAMVLILIGVYQYFIYPYTGREYVVAKDFNNINEPEQEPYNGKETIIIDGEEFNITLSYKYKLKGRVLATHHYAPTTMSNKLSPVDIGVAWGYIAKEDKFKELKCVETGLRSLLCRLESIDVEGLYSNSHLIPSNDKIKKQIKKIKKNDYIQIEGYLVHVDADTKKGYFFWDSSTTREDSGDGACEVIYVTDVKWLKPAK